MQGYVPRILLCGDLNSFANAANMAVEVVGEISFTGAVERGEFLIFQSHAYAQAYVPKDFRVFLDGAEISVDTLRKILDGAADYIVFDDEGEFIARYNELTAFQFTERFITRKTLFRQARHNFYSYTNFLALVKLIRENNFSRVLDADGFFAETNFCFYPELLPTVDAVAKNFDRSNFFFENFYDKIFDTTEDCRFKFYDAILIAERSPENFIDALLATKELSENVITFARKNSVFESWLSVNENVFEKISAAPAVNGNWYLLTKRVPKDFCVYVVTHKNVKLDEPPEGYKIIHAGHVISEDSGYLGDDTGDNVSVLNPYINEATALYWIWKNTSHTTLGFVHYRRFFTAKTKLKEDARKGLNVPFSAENILSRDEAEKILRDYDIIVSENKIADMAISCWHKMISGGDLESFVEKIFLKHIALKQPEYLESFEQTAATMALFPYEIFITRRNIFDAYCEWLFSFLIDVTNEVLARTNIKQIDNPRKYRILSFFTERLMTVWLRKNRLRVKKLAVMFRDDV